MKFITILTTSLLSAGALAAPSILYARKGKEIEFVSCVTKAVNQMKRAHPDAKLLKADFSSTTRIIVTNVNFQMNKLEVTFDSQAAGGDIILKTKEKLADDPSDKCDFENERLVPGHTLQGQPIDFPADAPVSLAAAQTAFEKSNSLEGFSHFTLSKEPGANQASYTFEERPSARKTKIGAADGKVLSTAPPAPPRTPPVPQYPETPGAQGVFF